MTNTERIAEARRLAEDFDLGPKGSNPEPSAVLRGLASALEECEAKVRLEALVKAVNQSKLPKRWSAENQILFDETMEAQTSLATPSPAAERLLAQVKAAGPLYQAAETIFSVAVNSNVGDHRTCPHGNAPIYPAHGRWCDECFNALDDALAAYRATKEG